MNSTELQKMIDDDYFSKMYLDGNIFPVLNIWEKWLSIEKVMLPTMLSVPKKEHMTMLFGTFSSTYYIFQT